MSSKHLKLTIHWLFILMVFVVPLVFSFNTSELFEFPKMLLVYGFTTLILSLWLARWALEKRVIFRRTPLDIPILIFLLSQLISTVLSIHPYTSIFGYYSRFHGGLLSTLSYIALYYALVSNGSLKLFKKMLLSSLISGLVVAVYGILEHFGHSFSCLMVSGGQSFGVDCWVQDVKTRVFATLGQPNWLAALMDMLVFFALYLGLKSQKIWQALAWLVVALSFVLAIIYSGSRSGFLAVGVGLMFWLTMNLITLLKKAKKPNTKHTYYVTGLNTKHTYYFLASLVIGFLLLVGVSGTPFSKSLGQVLKQTTQGLKLTSTQSPANLKPQVKAMAKPAQGGTESGVIRAIVWKGALKVWRRYPVFGSGVETFAYSYYQDRPKAHNLVSEWNFLYNKAHNELLNFLANTGLVGLLSYLGLMATFSFVALKLWWQGRRPLFATSILTAVLALSISNFFGFSTVSVSLLMWLVFGALSLIWLKDQPLGQEPAKESQEPQVKHRSKKAKKRYEKLLKKQNQARLKPKKLASKAQKLEGWQYLALSTIALGSLFSLAWIWRSYTADKAYKQGEIYLKSGRFQEGFSLLESAVRKKPKEAIFYSRLAFNQAKLALVLAQQGQVQSAEQAAAVTLETSKQALKLNGRHLNIHKTQAKTLTLLAASYETLASLSPTKETKANYLAKAKEMLLEAKGVLERARHLAPNEPSVALDLAKVEAALNNSSAARALYEETISLKPNYSEAIYTYAQFLIDQKDYQKALKMLELYHTKIDPTNKKVKTQLDELKQLMATSSGKRF